MDGVGRSRRPAGRDRPGLILKVETLPRRARDRELRERVGLQLLLSQRRLPRQTRPPRGNPPPFPGPLCGPLLDGALVRLRFVVLASSWLAVFSSTMTAGPPSVAIRVAATLPSNEWISGAGSGEAAVAAAGSGVSGDGGELHFRSGNGRFGFGRRGRSGRCLRAGLLCRGFRLCRFDLHRLCRLSAASFSGSAGRASGVCPAGAGASMVASGTAAAETFSAGFSATGGSTRSNASVGGGPSLRRANIGSGVTRREGRLANSSCAARNRAAAPSPKTRTDIESTIAVNRKRKPGSMDASSTPSLCLEGY